ncbi:MAG: cation:proton antiporter subunit C [Gemmatimonadota bacterium]
MRILGLYNYWIFVALMMIGLYTVIARDHLVKKLIGLSIFQTSVFIFYISMGKIHGGTAPILIEDPEAAAHGGEAAGHGLSLLEGVVYSNPLPHVLILTAIVVGIATTAVGLALVVRIKESYGTVEEGEILAVEQEMPS